MFRLDRVLAVGGYKEMPYFEDWYLWDRMISRGHKAINLDEYLVDFRATNEMVKRRYGRNYLRFERNFFLRRLKEGNTSRILLVLSLFLRQFSKLFGFAVYKKIFFTVRS